MREVWLYLEFAQFLDNMRSFCFLHSSIHGIEDFNNYLKLGDLLNGIDITWDMESPDILISTEHIFYKPYFWNLFRKLSKKAQVNVFFSLEAMSVDFNMFDLGLTYDNTITSSRFCQVLPPEDYYTSFISKTFNDIESKEQAMELIKGRGFCNFLYSNGHAHPMRDRLFYELSKYKRVDSLGMHLNNVDKRGTGFQGHAAESVPIKSTYKFSIACENACFPGYTTEKILTSLEAHTVPIYFGNKDISLDVNSSCYINVMDYNNLSEVVQRVREIDNNDMLWCEMVSKPWYLKKHLERKQVRRNNYKQMILKIFCDNINKLKYRCEGTWAYKYDDFYFRKGPMSKYQRLICHASRLLFKY